MSGQATETRLVVRVLYWGQFTFIYGHHMGTSQTYVLHFDYIMRVKMVYGGTARIVLGLQKIQFIRTFFSSQDHNCAQYAHSSNFETHDSRELLE